MINGSTRRRPSRRHPRSLRPLLILILLFAPFAARAQENHGYVNLFPAKNIVWSENFNGANAPIPGDAVGYDYANKLMPTEPDGKNWWSAYVGEFNRKQEQNRAKDGLRYGMGATGTVYKQIAGYALGSPAFANYDKDVAISLGRNPYTGRADASFVVTPEIPIANQNGELYFSFYTSYSFLYKTPGSNYPYESGEFLFPEGGLNDKICLNVYIKKTEAGVETWEKIGTYPFQPYQGWLPGGEMFVEAKLPEWTKTEAKVQFKVELPAYSTTANEAEDVWFWVQKATSGTNVPRPGEVKKETVYSATAKPGEDFIPTDKNESTLDRVTYLHEVFLDNFAITTTQKVSLIYRPGLQRTDNPYPYQKDVWGYFDYKDNGAAKKAYALQIDVPKGMEAPAVTFVQTNSTRTFIGWYPDRWPKTTRQEIASKSGQFRVLEEFKDRNDLKTKITFQLVDEAGKPITDHGGATITLIAPDQEQPEKRTIANGNAEAEITKVKAYAYASPYDLTVEWDANSPYYVKGAQPIPIDNRGGKQEGGFQTQTIPVVLARHGNDALKVVVLDKKDDKKLQGAKVIVDKRQLITKSNGEAIDTWTGNAIKEIYIHREGYMTQKVTPDMAKDFPTQQAQTLAGTPITYHTYTIKLEETKPYGLQISHADFVPDDNDDPIPGVKPPTVVFDDDPQKAVRFEGNKYWVDGDATVTFFTDPADVSKKSVYKGRWGGKLSLEGGTPTDGIAPDENSIYKLVQLRGLKLQPNVVPVNAKSQLGKDDDGKYADLLFPESYKADRFTAENEGADFTLEANKPVALTAKYVGSHSIQINDRIGVRSVTLKVVPKLMPTTVLCGTTGPVPVLAFAPTKDNKDPDPQYTPLDAKYSLKPLEGAKAKLEKEEGKWVLKPEPVDAPFDAQGAKTIIQLDERDATGKTVIDQSEVLFVNPLRAVVKKGAASPIHQKGCTAEEKSAGTLEKTQIGEDSHGNVTVNAEGQVQSTDKGKPGELETLTIPLNDKSNREFKVRHYGEPLHLFVPFSDKGTTAKDIWLAEDPTKEVKPTEIAKLPEDYAVGDLADLVSEKTGGKWQVKPAEGKSWGDLVDIANPKSFKVTDPTFAAYYDGGAYEKDVKILSMKLEVAPQRALKGEKVTFTPTWSADLPAPAELQINTVGEWKTVEGVKIGNSGEAIEYTTTQPGTYSFKLKGLYNADPIESNEVSVEVIIGNGYTVSLKDYQTGGPVPDGITVTMTPTGGQPVVQTTADGTGAVAFEDLLPETSCKIEVAGDGYNSRAWDIAKIADEPNSVVTLYKALPKYTVAKGARLTLREQNGAQLVGTPTKEATIKGFDIELPDVIVGIELGSFENALVLEHTDTKETGGKYTRTATVEVVDQTGNIQLTLAPNVQEAGKEITATIEWTGDGIPVLYGINNEEVKGLVQPDPAVKVWTVQYTIPAGTTKDTHLLRAEQGGVFSTARVEVVEDATVVPPPASIALTLSPVEVAPNSIVAVTVNWPTDGTAPEVTADDAAKTRIPVDVKDGKWQGVYIVPKDAAPNTRIRITATGKDAANNPSAFQSVRVVDIQTVKPSGALNLALNPTFAKAGGTTKATITWSGSEDQVPILTGINGELITNLVPAPNTAKTWTFDYTVPEGTKEGAYPLKAWCQGVEDTEMLEVIAEGTDKPALPELSITLDRQHVQRGDIIIATITWLRGTDKPTFIVDGHDRTLVNVNATTWKYDYQVPADAKPGALIIFKATATHDKKEYTDDENAYVGNGAFIPDAKSLLQITATPAKAKPNEQVLLAILWETTKPDLQGKSPILLDNDGNEIHGLQRDNSDGLWKVKYTLPATAKPDTKLAFTTEVAGYEGKTSILVLPSDGTEPKTPHLTLTLEPQKQLPGKKVKVKVQWTGAETPQVHPLNAEGEPVTDPIPLTQNEANKSLWEGTYTIDEEEQRNVVMLRATAADQTADQGIWVLAPPRGALDLKVQPKAVPTDGTVNVTITWTGNPDANLQLFGINGKPVDLKVAKKDVQPDKTIWTLEYPIPAGTAARRNHTLLAECEGAQDNEKIEVYDKDGKPQFASLDLSLNPLEVQPNQQAIAVKVVWTGDGEPTVIDEFGTPIPVTRNEEENTWTGTYNLPTDVRPAVITFTATAKHGDENYEDTQDLLLRSPFAIDIAYIQVIPGMTFAITATNAANWAVVDTEQLYEGENPKLRKASNGPAKSMTFTVIPEGEQRMKWGESVWVRVSDASGSAILFCLVEMLPDPEDPSAPSSGTGEEGATPVASDLLANVVIAPNPMENGTLRLLHTEHTARIELFDAMGILLYSAKHDGAPILMKHVPGLRTGVYLIRLYDANGGMHTLRAIAR